MEAMFGNNLLRKEPARSLQRCCMDRSRIVQDCERILQDPARITQRGTLAVQNMLCFRKALEASMAKVSALMSLSMPSLSGVQDVCVVFLNSLVLQRKGKTRTELGAWVVVFLASSKLTVSDLISALRLDPEQCAKIHRAARQDCENATDAMPCSSAEHVDPQMHHVASTTCASWNCPLKSTCSLHFQLALSRVDELPATPSLWSEQTMRRDEP